MGRRHYGAWFAALLAVELAIALWVRDAWVRPYGGDVLAVGLVYALLRALTHLSLRAALSYTLLIAGTLELAQGARVLTRLGLEGVWGVGVVLGSHFDLADLAAYGLGAALVWALERAWHVGAPDARSAEKLPDLR